MEMFDHIDFEIPDCDCDVVAFLDYDERGKGSTQQRAELVEDIYKKAPVASKGDYRETLYLVFPETPNPSIRGGLSKLKQALDVPPWDRAEQTCTTCGIEAEGGAEVQSIFGCQEDEEGRLVACSQCKGCQYVDDFVDKVRVPTPEEVEAFLWEHTDLGEDRREACAQAVAGDLFDKTKECPAEDCDVEAEDTADAREKFGYRTMGNNKVYFQSHCRECRK